MTAMDAAGQLPVSEKAQTGHRDDPFRVTASRCSEESLELPELWHGIFTCEVVQALTGALGLDRDGIVSLQDLDEYVARRVTRRARVLGPDQHPVMKGEPEGVLRLVKVRR